MEIENDEKSFYGKIYLNKGASLQELSLAGHKIIQNLSPLDYKDTFASSLLFPFANRIKDGTYEFNGEMHQLETNQVQENNALHGLIYNKTFKITSKETNADNAKISLEYIETNKAKGFPFTYKIQVDYLFKNNAMSLGITVTNTDDNPFPFTLGWHPYFISDNLYNSKLIIDSHQKLALGERNITTGVNTIENVGEMAIKDQQLDDCWVLNSDQVTFKTPNYNLQFGSSVKNNFLQAYTPPKENTIAIEPTTGVSDSFNNKIGLEILKPNTSYNIIWNLKIN